MYSAQFDKFSFNKLNEKFTTKESNIAFGCTVTIFINYQLQIIRLAYTTTSLNLDDDAYRLLQKNKIIIKFMTTLTINNDEKQDDTLRITYICLTTSDCTRLYIEYLLSKDRRELIFDTKPNIEWIDVLKKLLVKSSTTNVTNIPHQCFLGSQKIVNCSNHIRRCSFFKTLPSEKTGSKCHVINETEQAYIIIESIATAIEGEIDWLWALNADYSENYLCNYPFCNSPDIIKDVMFWTSLFYNPGMFVHGILERLETTTTQKTITSTKKKPINIGWENRTFCSRTLYYIYDDEYENTFDYINKLKEKYRYIEQEKINADFCLLTITINVKTHSININLDGLNNDNENIYKSSLTSNNWFGLQSGSVQYDIIYICSFDLCNEKLYLSDHLDEMIRSKINDQDNLYLLEYFQDQLYDEADLVVNCFDEELDVVKCEEGVCYASGDKYFNDSFHAYCFKQNNLSEKYFINIMSQLLPTDDEEALNNYQITYACNINSPFKCNELIAFEMIYKYLGIRLYLISDLKRISKRNIFYNSITQSSTHLSSQTFTNDYSMGTSISTEYAHNITTSTFSVTIANQSDRNKQIQKLYFILIIIYLFQ